MDTVKFIIENYIDEENGFCFPTINIYINDINLIDLVERVEQRERILRGEKPLRAEYIGLEPHSRYSEEFLALHNRPNSVLLTCTCTVEMCNCIMAKISIDAQTVTWSELKSPWLGGRTPSPWVTVEEAQEGDWAPIDYSDLGPFVFDREQYMDALNKIIAA